MISTTRLEIKPWTIADAEDFYNLTQDAGFNLFPITRYRQESLESAREWVRAAAGLNAQTRGLGKFAVRELATDNLIGMGGLTPWKFENGAQAEELIDITYRIRESAWGKGYGMELAEGLKRYAFESLKLSQITATITPDNEASKKIAEKLGLRFDRKITLLGVNTDLFRMFR